MIGDLSNIRKWQKKTSDKYYTQLVEAQDEVMFEFNRNKEFFENLLETKLERTKPHIDLQQKELPFKLPQKYAILFIGASASFRKWDIEKFAEVGQYLKKKYDYELAIEEPCSIKTYCPTLVAVVEHKLRESFWKNSSFQTRHESPHPPTENFLMRGKFPHP